MRRYVVGFLFNEDESGVVLLRKRRPEWQAGKLNGIGGHVEPGEVFAAAMVREGREEAGDIFGWEQFATLQGDGWIMGCFRAYYTALWNIPATNDVGEFLELHTVEDIVRGRLKTIPNLRWLVPLALSTSRHDWPYAIQEKAGLATPTGD